MPGCRKSLDRSLSPLTESPLTTSKSLWWTSPSYQQSSLPLHPLAFHSVTDALLENPNLNSSHLFRADIVSDSAGILKTNREKEEFCHIETKKPIPGVQADEAHLKDAADEPRPPLIFDGFELRRTVLRRLIPRKPQLDRLLAQTCHIYTGCQAKTSECQEDLVYETRLEADLACLSTDEKLKNRTVYKQASTQENEHLVVYQPHVEPLLGSDMPWYHPPLKSLAFFYSFELQPRLEEERHISGTLSIHFQFFQAECCDEAYRLMTPRLHRTVLSLLSTYVRLARNTPVLFDDIQGEEKAMPISTTRHIKDNIVPEHLVQNTYSRLKRLYASNLIHSWVEKTDSSKHVFEDLSIAAFLIELWRKIYGDYDAHFPGFVDIACGNGVLVYILIMEGFRGWGFDARARRTWSTFPAKVTANLKQMSCIPRPFLEALRSEEYPLDDDLLAHDGIFDKDTFIISNHADELTTWTPLLAALSSPACPLPWLAIPCCSHALSGAAYRYHSSETKIGGRAKSRCGIHQFPNGDTALPSGDEQLRTGDLTALRGWKNQSRNRFKQGQPNASPSSTYASLVEHVMHLARKIHHADDVQQTLMRIPSTRNIGLIGGHQGRVQPQNMAIPYMSQGEELQSSTCVELETRVYEIVEQECVASGGVLAAAQIWMEGVKKARGTTRHTFTSGSVP